jgi:glutamine synthetase
MKLAPPKQILKSITQRFIEETGYIPVVASEIEFYLSGTLTDAFRDDCYKQFGEAGILTFEFAEEKAEHHYEISLVHQPDPLRMAESTLLVKKVIGETSMDHGLGALFTAKPFPDKPGSGLHIHLSLKNKDGLNPFIKKGGEEETATMRAAIGGLCAMMPESMPFFAPFEDSYARYTAQTNEDEEEGARYNNAPVNISWGGNNRTTAIRIPSSTLVPENRHLEHRVAGSDADPTLVIAAVLAGAHLGLTRNIDAGPKIWGNAFELQYNLPALPTSLKEATALFEKGKLLKPYLPAAA